MKQLTIFFLVFNVAIILNSCSKKEIQKSISKNTVSTTTNPNALLRTEEGIRNFLSKFIHSKKRGLDTMNIIDAETNIENALNFEYCAALQTDSTYNKFYDSVFTINNISTPLNTTTIQEIYNGVLNILRATNNTFTTTTHQLSFVDLSFEPIGTNLNIKVNYSFNIPQPDYAAMHTYQSRWNFAYIDGGWGWFDQGGFWPTPTINYYLGLYGAPEKLTQYAQHNLFISPVLISGYYINTTTVPFSGSRLGMPYGLSAYRFDYTNPYYLLWSSIISPYVTYENHQLDAAVTLWTNYATEAIPDYAMNYYLQQIEYYITTV